MSTNGNTTSGNAGGDGNSAKRRRQPQNRRRKQAKQKPVRLWRPVPQLPDPVPVVPAADPTVVLRSLGDLPLQGQVAVAEHYVAAVVERAAALATALAASADLLGGHGDDDEA